MRSGGGSVGVWGWIVLGIAVAACADTRATPLAADPGAEPSTGGGGEARADSAAAPAATSGCEGGGASYDVTLSKFAFGSVPTSEQIGGDTRWTGAHGVLAIRANGHASASSNATSPELAVADWSEDPDALTAHVREYFASLGIDACQVGRADVHGGNVGRMIALRRAVDGIVVGESMAHAKMNANDLTTTEGFYWPTIPADAVTAARAFRDRIATPEGLAAYKEKLPSNARGDGTLVLHHTSAVVLPGETKEFRAMATWDVMLDDAHSSALPSSFDENGAPVETSW